MKGKGEAPASRADLAGVEGRLDARIADVEGRLNAKIADVEGRLDAKIGRVAMELVKTQDRLKTIEDTMANKDDVGRILAAIDVFAGKAVAYDQKSLSHGAILTDHEDKLREHGRRLAALETKS